MSQVPALPAPSEEPEDEVEGYRMTLLEHLWELRTRLIRALLVVVVSFSVMLPFGANISRILRAPAMPYFPEGSGFSSISPVEVFVTNLKLSLFAGMFLAAPFLFFEVWGFVAPGLYKKERRLVVPFVFFSTLFFTSGALFGYFLILPYTMQFLLSFSGDGIDSAISVASYLSDTTRLLLAFGAVFQMPLAILLLARAGLVTAQGLSKFRRYAIIIIFIVAAVLTPPDPITQVGLALPLCLLYELGIVVARLWGRPPLGSTPPAP